MNILTILRKKEGAIHWYGQRMTALAIAPLMLFFILQGALRVSSHPFSYELILNLINSYPILSFFSLLLIIWHGSSGIESILDDYVHDEKVKFISITLIKAVGLLIIKYAYILICI